MGYADTEKFARVTWLYFNSFLWCYTDFAAVNSE